MGILRRLTLLFNRFTPVESALFRAVEEKLPRQAALLFRKQLAAVNQVQRALDWEEIDFFCLRFRRFIRWNPKILFPNRSEFILARIAYKADGEDVESMIWAARGHVYSLETEGGVKRHAFAGKIEVEEVTLSEEIMTEKEPGEGRRGQFEETEEL